jgi:hypothetical protein
MVRTGYGPEGTQAQWHDFAEFVRRALHAAADQVEPQADGLEPIRAKIPAGSGHCQPAHREPAPRRAGGPWHRVRRGARRGRPGTGAHRR